MGSINLYFMSCARKNGNMTDQLPAILSCALPHVTSAFDVLIDAAFCSSKGDKRQILNEAMHNPFFASAG
jgi:hypothetical protein